MSLFTKSKNFYIQVLNNLLIHNKQKSHAKYKESNMKHQNVTVENKW